MALSLTMSGRSVSMRSCRQNTRQDRPLPLLAGHDFSRNCAGCTQCFVRDCSGLDASAEHRSSAYTPAQSWAPSKVDGLLEPERSAARRQRRHKRVCWARTTRTCISQSLTNPLQQPMPQAKGLKYIRPRIRISSGLKSRCTSDEMEMSCPADLS